jgi:non-lysosomal glucosylceramidase
MGDGAMGQCGRDCECNDNDVSRREFLQIGAGAVAAAGIAATGRFALAAPGDFPPSCQTPPPKAWFDSLFERGEPPAYQGEALKNVALPLGGIGTGTVWLHGTGRLTAWQIFNNINRSSQVDDSFFAVRVEEEGKPPVVRALQMPPVGPIKGVESVRFVGQYPFAYVHFEDPALSVKLRLEAFNPMIPLDDEDSGIPCAIFRIIATNPGNKPVRVSFLASMQNAVGHQGEGASVGVEYPTYGQNVNRLVRDPRMLAIRMHAEPGIPAQLSRAMTLYLDHDAITTGDAWPVSRLTVRSVGPTADEVETSAVYWIDKGNLSRMGGAALTAVANAVRSGATLIISGVENPLLHRVKATTTDESPREEETFANFESPTYRSWKLQGTGFGEGPSRGTMPGQQPVSGYLGGGLVNTFDPNDEARGSLVSPLFTIRARYITFLIGGGNKPGKCCLNLRVEGRIVRTATGKDNEVLERRNWDVQDLLGKEATLEIVDADTGGWGHVLVDDIRFGNMPTETVTKAEAEAWNKLLPIFLEAPATRTSTAGKQERTLEIDRTKPELAAATIDRIRLAVAPDRRFTGVRDGTTVVLKFEDGTPAILAAGRDQGKVFVIPADIVGAEAKDPVRRRDACLSLVAGLAGIGFEPASGRPVSAPSFGTMCLATPSTDASLLAGWQSREALLKTFAENGRLSGSPEQEGPSGPGRTINAALATQRTVAPGMSGDAEFVLTWHFPNQYYPQKAWHAGKTTGTAVGNMYANTFYDALSVATYVVTDRVRLREQTERFRRCLYESSLPNYLVDCIGANASILRSPTCFWIKDGTFYGFEGCGASGGCCPMNCNHVWNYEHSLSKLWPALERNMRITELDYHQQRDGGIHHRVEVPRDNPNKRQFPVADGQCGAVLKAYREHLQSADRSFLNDHWERIRKAMDFAISNWDSNADGVMDKPQFNTYDDVIHGLNTFIGSLYLTALRAAEEMARLMKDAAAAKRYRGLYESGRSFCAEKLYDGEYYIHISDNLHHGYGKGCFSDQVVGQWWARVLNLGDILPPEQVRSALQAIYKHSWLTSQKGFQGTQRYLQFADGDDKGLLICSWPKGGRPPGEEPILYRDEVWTGVEYQVAAHKIYEGGDQQLREGLAIVKGARERYAGTKRNPWDEIECGDYYARAMSSWTLLLAAQGYVYDGPAKVLGFNPRLHADDHRSFFSAAEGWGQFTQKRSARTQTNGVSVAWGRCEISRLELGLPAEAKTASVKAKVGEKTLSPNVSVREARAVLAFDVPVVVMADESLEVSIEWS